MGLTAADVQRIARLARIAITSAEADDLRAKLDGIFGLIEKMRGVDTTGIEPMAHAQDVVLPMREDLVTEADQRALYQAVAPDVQSGLYLVPKVVE